MCHTVFEANIGLKNNTIFLSCVKASVIGHVGFHCSNASSTIHSIINKHTLPFTLGIRMPTILQEHLALHLNNQSHKCSGSGHSAL